jgi:hypothetical protein
MAFKFFGSAALITLLISACVQPVDSLPGADETPAFERQSLTEAPAALLVVGSTTLVAGDTALKNRLQTLGFTVTVRAGTAVSAADAAGKVVLVSESVASADVNTKLRNVAVPVVSLEPSLFDDLGFVEAVATNYGTAASQSSLVLLGTPGSLSGDVTVNVTSSAQTFAWGKPVPSAARIATVAGDASRAAIFSFERGSALAGMTAPARRAGWFATADAPTAFNANGWSLFDALMGWAKAGLTAACTSNADCPGSTCVASSCSTTCAAGYTSCSGACVSLATSASNCGGCGNACSAGKICSAGACTTSCATNSDCPGTSCVAGACSTTCAAGYTSCSGACVNLATSSNNCGGCANACQAGLSCHAGSCS